MKIARDGVPVVLIVLFLALVAVLSGWMMNNIWSLGLYALAVIMSGFVLFFFRDPDRTIPEEDVILAPADGRVLSADVVDEPTYLKTKVRQISIFLSIADVHVNRHPVSGIAEHVVYFPGKYLVAWHPKASSENERAEFGILHQSGIRILFRQITGLVARRIVYHVKEGEVVRAGERFGLMRFGSRMDILLPAEIPLEIKPGDRTVAGETILARFPTIADTPTMVAENESG